MSAALSHEEMMRAVAIVLVRPKYPENIGAAMRVAWNMGISSVTVVTEKGLNMSAVRRTATHHAAAVVDAAVFTPEVEKALAPFSVAVAATARRGRMRQADVRPEQLADELRPWVIRGGRAALVFGPEDTGLTNEDIRHCALLTTIPTADFSSLNLAQAVAVLSYELFRGFGAATGGDDMRPRPATIAERAPMHEAAEQLFGILDELGGRDKAAYRAHHLRRYLDRQGISAREALLFKEICREITLYLGRN